MNKIIVPILCIIAGLGIGISGMMIFATSEIESEMTLQIEEDRIVIAVLKDALAAKNLEYEWLSEMSNFLLSNNGKLPPIEQTKPFSPT